MAGFPITLRCNSRALLIARVGGSDRKGARRKGVAAGQQVRRVIGRRRGVRGSAPAPSPMDGLPEGSQGGTVGERNRA